MAMFVKETARFLNAWRDYGCSDVLKFNDWPDGDAGLSDEQKGKLYALAYPPHGGPWPHVESVGQSACFPDATLDGYEVFAVLYPELAALDRGSRLSSVDTVADAREWLVAFTREVSAAGGPEGYVSRFGAVARILPVVASIVGLMTWQEDADGDRDPVEVRESRSEAADAWNTLRKVLAAGVAVR